MRSHAAVATATVLSALALPALAEDLHKDGLTTSGVRLSYEATALADGRLQVELTLECREKKLEPIHGAAIVAVISKAGAAPDIQKSSLSCTVTGGQDRVTASNKNTAKVILSGVTPADIGTKVFVVGRSKADDSPKMDSAIRKLEDAVQKEVEKLTKS